MTKNRPKTFVGIAEVTEVLCGTTRYFYSLVDPKTGATSYTNLRQVGKDLVAMFANKARDNITLLPPRGLHNTLGTLCYSVYHPLSVLEADRLSQEIERAQSGAQK